MAPSQKRQRNDADNVYADCQFTVEVLESERHRAQKRRKVIAANENGNLRKPRLRQLSPFTPTGRFATYDTMDVSYTVEPAREWKRMTRYNSFI
ncbi:hypothetical protein MCOR05_010346, partial [Pyricularia oryzae]